MRLNRAGGVATVATAPGMTMMVVQLPLIAQYAAIIVAADYRSESTTPTHARSGTCWAAMRSLDTNTQALTALSWVVAIVRVTCEIMP
jgi:hypothetical protein